jgi:hypothetical protein
MKMTTLLFKSNQPVILADSFIDKGELWVPIEKLTQLTGLELKPEGICFDAFVQQDKRLFNITAFARLMGYPIVHNSHQDVWVIGEGAVSQGQIPSTLYAPDFTLPDLSGKTFSLSSFLGKKVLLVSWASW